jgi:hypothetical protein
LSNPPNKKVIIHSFKQKGPCEILTSIEPHKQ